MTKEYDSEWRKKNGKRKLRVKVGIQGESDIRNGARVRSHIEVSFRKKTWLGWANYSSYTSIVFKCDRKDYSSHRDGTSSHDYYFHLGVFPFYYPIGNGEYRRYMFPMDWSLSLYYRGFGETVSHSGQYPGHYIFRL